MLDIRRGGGVGVYLVLLKVRRVLIFRGGVCVSEDKGGGSVCTIERGGGGVLPNSQILVSLTFFLT